LIKVNIYQLYYYIYPCKSNPMLTRRISALALLISIFNFSFFSGYSQNLVLCPGAESDPLTNGWTLVYSGIDCYTSSGWRIQGGQNSYPVAQEGTHFFFPGCKNSPDVAGTTYELYQDINVQSNMSLIDAGYYQVIFSGYLSTYNSANYDNSEIKVEYRDETNSNVLASYSTAIASPVSWTNYTDSRAAPTGTRFIRVRLISTLRSGPSVDSYFDNISITALSTLPVTLVNLSAGYNEEKAIISWDTKDEVNNKGFYIQRSPDGLAWISIGFVPAKNEGSSTTHYEFGDNEPNRETAYYRLQQVDIDGRVKYSKVVVVKAETAQAVKVFPNPITNFIFIASSSQPRSVEIFNNAGVIIRKINKPVRGGIAVGDLPPGLYSIKIQFATTTVLKKIVKQ